VSGTTSLPKALLAVPWYSRELPKSLKRPRAYLIPARSVVALTVPWRCYTADATKSWADATVFRDRRTSLKKSNKQNQNLLAVRICENDRSGEIDEGLKRCINVA
jgi:hypothetical protein